jgi:hypothetical protein
MGNHTKKGDFKPGNKFGLGRPRLPDSIKSIQKMPKEILERLISKYLMMDLEELRDISNTKMNSLPVIEAYLVAIIVEGMSKRNFAIMEWLMMRSIGRIQDDPNADETDRTTHAELVKFFRERKEMLESTNLNTIDR